MSSAPTLACFTFVAVLLFPASATAEDALSYDEVMRQAAARAPAVRSASHNATKAEAAILASRGSFDPQLQVTGGWNLSQGLQRFGGVGGVLKVNSQSWNTGLTLTQRTPIGTTVAFSGNFAQQSTDFTGSTSTVAGSTQRLFAPYGPPLRSQGVPMLPSQSYAKSNATSTANTDSTTSPSAISFHNYVPRFNLSIQQELLRGIRMASNLADIRKAKQQHSVQELVVMKARQTALADTAQAYWTWVYQDAVVKIRERAEATAREALRVGSAKVKAGRAAAVEQTRLETAVIQAQIDKLAAVNAAAQARDQVLILIGEQPGLDVQPVSVPGDAAQQDVSLSTAVEAAMVGNVDIQLAQHNIEFAQLALADARHAVLPELILGIQGGLNGFSQKSWADAFHYGNGMFPNIGINGTLNVPLANRAAIGARKQAAAEVSRLEAVRDQTQAQVRLQVGTQVRAIATARHAMELADANARLARETLQAEEARYTAGRSVLQDVLTARDQLASAEGAAVKARTDYRTAIVLLQELQGRLEQP